MAFPWRWGVGAFSNLLCNSSLMDMQHAWETTKSWLGPGNATEETEKEVSFSSLVEDSFTASVEIAAVGGDKVLLAPSLTHVQKGSGGREPRQEELDHRMLFHLMWEIFMNHIMSKCEFSHNLSSMDWSKLLKNQFEFFAAHADRPLWTVVVGFFSQLLKEAVASLKPFPICRVTHLSWRAGILEGHCRYCLKRSSNACPMVLMMSWARPSQLSSMWHAGRDGETGKVFNSIFLENQHYSFTSLFHI